MNTTVPRFAVALAGTLAILLAAPATSLADDKQYVKRYQGAQKINKETPKPSGKAPAKARHHVRYDGPRQPRHYSPHRPVHRHAYPMRWHKRVVHVHNVHLWRTGRWHHGHHHGHFGWWWIVGNTWHFYASPAYPYPDHTRAVVLVPAAAAEPAAVNVAPPPQYWYYCRSQDEYYPYIASCAEGWETVPATPAKTQ